MIPVTLYSRKECSLCESALVDLEALQEQIPHQLQVIDVDEHPELQKAYGEAVPVVEVGPYRLKAPFSRQELLITLGAARDRLRQIEALNDPGYVSLHPARVTWNNSDRFTYWLSRHYLAVLNTLVLFYLGLPILAPILMHAGLETPARLIYRGYGFVCHQLAFRSFFLFGDQPVYPRRAAGLEGYRTYEEISGNDQTGAASDLIAASRYIGEDGVGYKIALCQRDLSIYGAILAFGVLFALTGRKLQPLPWYIWVVVGLLPIGVDGLSQLLSQPPINLFPYRESTPLLRVLTGFLFGFTTAWFGYPLVEQAMRDSRELLEGKYRRYLAAGAKQAPSRGSSVSD